MQIKIFVEGVADIKFLSDFILFKYGINLDKEVIVETKGWTNIYNEDSAGEFIKNKMIENSDNNGTNLLIFDADKDFKLRLQEIVEWKTKLKLDFEIFLWPNNNESGDLETVLEKIINQKNSPIFDCWDTYEKCLSSKTIEGRAKPLTIPAKKTKIYGYLEALLGESKSQKEKIKERNRDYKITDFWNLNSEYLYPLSDFLDKYIKN